MAAATGFMSTSLNLEDANFMEGTVANPSSGEFQVAAYQALLASLLSPCCHRPPYLAQGLAVFRNGITVMLLTPSALLFLYFFAAFCNQSRRIHSTLILLPAGRQEAGTEVAAVCAHALLALETLIHPRCLPPAGTPAAVAAGMSAGRATCATLVPHMQRTSKPPPTPAPIQDGITTGTMANGFAVPAVMSTLKIGQVAIDPWAEVDTWLGYGEDFGNDDSLFYSESDGILHVEDFSNSPGYGGALLNGTSGQVAPSCGPNVEKRADSCMDLKTQVVGVPRETVLYDLQPSHMVGGHPNLLQPLEKSILAEEESRREQCGVETLNSSAAAETPSLGPSLLDIRPVMAAQDTEAIAMSLEMEMEKSATGRMDNPHGDGQDGGDLCSSMQSRLLSTVNSFDETNNSNQAPGDVFAYSNVPVDVPTDSDSEGAFLGNVDEIDEDAKSD